MTTTRTLSRLGSLLLLAALWLALLAPAARAQEMMSHTYEVTITNLTDAQVFSPPLLATHADAAHVWQDGELASDEMRVLAEDGMNGPLAEALAGVATDVQALGDPLMPGKSVTVEIQANDGDVLSVATMLVQTNDGFTGVDSLSLAEDMMDDEMMMSMDSMVYDAGTEDNTEAASDVPGPPFMGMERVPTTPQEPIAMHPGLSADADVGSEFAWSGAVASIEVHQAMMSGDEMASGDAAADAPATMPETGSTTGTLALFLALGGLLFMGGAAVLRQRHA